MAAKDANIKEFIIQAAKDKGRGVDIREGLTSFSYYENILSNHSSCSFQLMDSGNSIEKDGKKVSIVEGLPIRGGEEIRISCLDSEKNPLKLEMYLNKMNSPDPTSTSDLLSISGVTKEFFSNEMTRVIKRYDGKISENVSSILREVLKADFKEENIDETANNYNFIGNDRKPFYTITWLGTKSIPTKEYGKTAGFFFFQTQDGMVYKSVDNLLGGKPKRKLVYTSSDALPTGYDAKIYSYEIDSTIDVQSALMLGVYNNRTLFFAPYSFKYDAITFDIKEQKAVQHGGSEDQFDNMPEEFTRSPTRLMTNILDVGAIPSGNNAIQQLKSWVASKNGTNDKVMERMVQSIMRYNQLFSVQSSITIDGDFSLRAGDMIKCDFPRVSEDKPTTDKSSSGQYLISSLCHYITPEKCYTQLGLIRDSYGRIKE